MSTTTPTPTPTPTPTLSMRKKVETLFFNNWHNKITPIVPEGQELKYTKHHTENEFISLTIQPYEIINAFERGEMIVTIFAETPTDIDEIQQELLMFLGQHRIDELTGKLSFGPLLQIGKLVYREARFEYLNSMCW